VIDFIDMVLESNRELVLRRLTECLGRDRTKHQVTEITSLGLVQMTRKRVGAGLLEAFSETCDCCKGRGVIVNLDSAPDRSRGREAVEKVKAVAAAPPAGGRRRAGRRGATSGPANGGQPPPEVPGPGEASAPGPAPAEEVDPLVELPEFAEPGGESQLSADGLGVVGMFRRFRRGGTRRRTRP
jgi:ribonuclease E